MSVVGNLAVDEQVVGLLLAGALGMLLGLEREWSNKSAGVRTFAITSLLGGAAATVGGDAVLVLGGVLVVAQGSVLGVRGLVFEGGETTAEHAGLSLTTSSSLLLAYVVGILAVDDYLLVAVALAVTSSLLLVLRRELHAFANGRSREEVRSTAEFAIIAFVVYPLLPGGTYGPWDAVDPRLVWTLVIAVSAMGFVDYALLQRYGSRGMALTGFLGGLVNSTAVVGAVANRVRTSPGLGPLVVGTVLLADAAMAVRNLAILVVFAPESALAFGFPLLSMAVGGVALSRWSTSWSGTLDVDVDFPFGGRNALAFGLLFVAVLLATAGAQHRFGTGGFLLSSLLTGLVSSGTTTTTAVALVTTGRVTPTVAAQGVFLGTLSSVAVKVGLAASVDRTLFVPVARQTLYLLGFGLVGVALGTNLA